VVTDDPLAEAGRIKKQQTHLTVEEILDSPKVAVGTVDEIVDRLRKRREELGITYYNVWAASMHTLAPVIEALRS
jgi:hypothetical protein